MLERDVTMMTANGTSKSEFLSFLENDSGLRIDNLVEGAIEVAEEVHAGVVRKDGSPFLETHTWPVAVDVVRRFMAANRSITGVEVASAILHDVMEDDERILNLYESKSYGFDAYLAYRFGNKIHRTASELKVRPLEDFAGATYEERQAARFHDYCNKLVKADYDVKVIKLADRLNNMLHIRKVPGHDKVRRYQREAEDFYIAYTMLPPKMSEFYNDIRRAYEDLRAIRPVVAVH
ncbi:MAG: hypothetical protein C4292_02355 [Nitrososphaera sp.]